MSNKFKKIKIFTTLSLLVKGGFSKSKQIPSTIVNAKVGPTDPKDL